MATLAVAVVRCPACGDDVNVELASQPALVAEAGVATFQILAGPITHDCPTPPARERVA